MHLTDEHYRRFFILRKLRPAVIGPIWLERSGIYIGDVLGIGEPEPIAEKDLAEMIDRLWHNSQLMLPLGV
jgi:hypothetical protein